jgi:hypothetical protein
VGDPILDQQLEPPAPPALPDPTPPADPPAPQGVTIDPTEYERLKRAADQFEQAAPLLDDLRSGRYQSAPPPAAPPLDTMTDQYWTDPIKSTEKMIDQRLESQVQPYARQVAAQLGTMAISNFKNSKSSDPYYAGAAPFFDKEMGKIDKTWLGQFQPDQQASILSTAWNAAIGAYVEDYRKKNPVRNNPPPNLGGNGSAGGGSGAGAKKSLQEIDPTTYRWAVQKGWSQERMDKFAEDLLAGEDN